MLVVVGTQLDNGPRFWDISDDWYIQDVKALMVSYADFHKSKVKRKKAMETGIRSYLGVQSEVQVYLDNGSFAFSRQGIKRPIKSYLEFVKEAQPDWYPIPTDYIPMPTQSKSIQKNLFLKTIDMDKRFASEVVIPVIHAGDWLEDYLDCIQKYDIPISRGIALGGLVPRLLSTRGSASRTEVIDAIKRTRKIVNNELHVFGIGSPTTLHLAAALGVDSVDSVGWRNRAARGLIFIPGRGERSIIPLGNWRGKEVAGEEVQMLTSCRCPACKKYGIEGLKLFNHRNNKSGKGNGTSGFYRRATHNLWTLLQEAKEIDIKHNRGEYESWYKNHISSSLMERLIEYALNSA